MPSKIKRLVLSLLLALVCFAPVLVMAATQDAEATVSNGKEVSIEYTLRLDDQEVVESNAGGEPLVFVYGAGQIIPGLESALAGMRSGESRKVTVKPADAYGEARKEAIIELDKLLIPADKELTVGSYLPIDAGGQTVNVKVVEIRENTVVLDGNHPLAGKTLHFDVSILDVRAASDAVN